MSTKCRLCFKDTQITKSLFEENGVELLRSLTSIKLENNETFSTSACITCWINLKKAYKIQQDFLKANHLFLQYDLEKSNTLGSCIIKTEVLEDYDHVHNVEFVKVEEDDDDDDKHEDKSSSDDDCTSSCRECGLKINANEAKLLKNPELCDICNETEETENFLTETISNNTNSLFCSECHKEFSNSKEYQKHLKNHTRKKCDICLKMITLPHFKKHKDNHIIDPIVCSICGKTSRNKHALRFHLLRNHRKIQFPCEICGKVFKVSGDRDVHQRRHSGTKTHICPTCGKGFYKTRELNIHVNTIHNLLKPHNCPHCNKNFSKRSNLKSHIRIHTNEQPYKCEVCGDGFIQNVSLKSHLKSKHNIEDEKNSACAICDMKFTSEHAIKTHMRRKHPSNCD